MKKEDHNDSKDIDNDLGQFICLPTLLPNIFIYVWDLVHLLNIASLIRKFHLLLTFWIIPNFFELADEKFDEIVWLFDRYMSGKSLLVLFWCIIKIILWVELLSLHASRHALSDWFINLWVSNPIFENGQPSIIWIFVFS